MGYFDEAIRYRHAYVIALSAAMGSIFYGWDIGLIGGVLALPSFKTYFGLDKLSASDNANISGNIVAVLQGGCLCVPCCDRWFPDRTDLWVPVSAPCSQGTWRTHSVASRC